SEQPQCYIDGGRPWRHDQRRDLGAQIRAEESARLESIGCPDAVRDPKNDEFLGCVRGTQREAGKQCEAVARVKSWHRSSRREAGQTRARPVTPQWPPQTQRDPRARDV